MKVTAGEVLGLIALIEAQARESAALWGGSAETLGLIGPVVERL